MNEKPNVPANLVRASVEEIFQTMYFSEAGFLGRASIQEWALETVVGFSGGATGEFRVAVSESLASKMAADFLARDSGETSTEEVDAIVTEFANVACGVTMNAWKPGANLHCSVPGPLIRRPVSEEFPFSFSVSGECADLGIDIRLA